jgi:hypothetical protein
MSLLAAGCGVSDSGLGNRPDAADGPRKAIDTQAAVDVDIHPLLPETLPDPTSDGASEAALVNAVDGSADPAPFPDAGAPGPDLLQADSMPVVDVPFATEVETTSDVPLTSDTSQADDAGDADDGPLAPQPDGPVIVQVDVAIPDTLLLDSSPLDLLPPDLAPADHAPDLPPIVDVPGPDLAPPDLGPQPTSNWVIDNTTSIGGFTTTVMGAPTVTALDAGTAVCFDGNQDGLLLGTNPIQGMQRFTIEVLVFPEFTGSADTRLIQITDSNNLRLVMGMRSVASGNWHALVTFSGSGPATTIEDSNAPHPSNQWYWLTVTYDGQTASVYVNGALENSRNLAFGPMAAGSASLATRPNGQYNFPGCMRDVKFFASALPVRQLDKP